MIEPHADRPRAITLGADKAYDAEDFVNELRSMNVTPHVAQNTSGRRSAIDGRTTRHAGYAVSQRIRKRIEEAFGWIKTVAGQEKTRFRGRRPRRMGLHLRRRRLQSGAAAEAAGGGRLMAKVPAFAKAFAGRWRIVEMDVWDNDFLDLVEEAHHHLRGQVGRRDRLRRAQAASSMSATARATVRPAPSSPGKGSTRTTPPAVADGSCIGTAGRLVGHFYIHNGDDSGFVCERD